MKKSLILVLVLMACAFTHAQNKSRQQLGPDCGGRDGWPANGTASVLKNVGVLDLTEVDWPRTMAKRLASQPTGRTDHGNPIWHQVYLVTFFTKSGKKVEAIAIHDASNLECSMTGIDVYVISRNIPEERGKR